METSERERVARLVRDARTHAEEAETSLGEREDDLTPLERRSAVDFATEMALFGWFPVPLVEGVESEKRAYGCALCGARSPSGRLRRCSRRESNTYLRRRGRRKGRKRPGRRFEGRWVDRTV